MKVETCRKPENVWGTKNTREPENAREPEIMEQKMSREILTFFGSISCDAGLKTRTRSYVLEKMNCHYKDRCHKAVSRKVRWGISFACLIFLVVNILGVYQLYYTEAAIISIDVNPSIELEINRWGRVVDEKSYGKDSEEVLSTVSLRHLEYEEALECLLGGEAMKKYLNPDSVLTITVDNRMNDGRLMANLQACVDHALVQHHDGVTAEYAAVEGHMCQEAHSHGISVGKYNAIKEIMEEDPKAKVDDFKNQSMKEIKNHMNHCEHQRDYDESWKSPATDSTQSDRDGCSRHGGDFGSHHSR